MPEKSGSNRNKVYIACIIVLLAVIGALVYMLMRPKDGEQIVVNKNRDPNASVGQYVGKTSEEIQAELDKIVEEGMFNISVNPNIFMENGEAEAELRIENIQANHHLMGVQITLDDTGEVVYASGLIEPGYYIQAARLLRPLSKGVYPATALFTAYDAQTEENVGQAAAKITITVQN